MRKQKLRRMRSPIIGESKCKTSLLVRKMLNNIYVSWHECISFISEQVDFEKSIKVDIAGVHSSKIVRLGKSAFNPPRILLKRQSVQIFLHELSHILAVYRHSDEGHGEDFCAVLDTTIKDWIRWKRSLNSKQRLKK